MSYDVSFCPRPGAEAPSIAALDAYFNQRGFTQADDGYARYENDITGVAFGWSYGERQRSYEDSGPISLTAPTSGNQTRALELVAEVEALVRAFDLLVEDPTMHGMGKGELDREALLRGCLFASRFGLCVDVMMQQLVPADALLYDDDRYAAQWRWNLEHAVLERNASDAVFVPKIRYLVHDREVLAWVSWTGDGPFLLPEVDVIATLDTRHGGADLVFVRTVALAGALESAPRREAPLRHRHVTPSAELAAAVAAATPLSPRPTMVPNTAVLGRAYPAEVAEQFRGWASGKEITFGRAR